MPDDLTTSPRGAPWMLRIARALDRQHWRGGTRLQAIAQRLGLLRRIARYRLDSTVSIDVPLDQRPMDATDAREYERDLVERLGEAIRAMPCAVTLFDCGADIGLISARLAAICPRLERIVAFEPNETVYAVLSGNLSRLPIPAVAVRAAVGAAPGRGALRRHALDPADVARFVVYDADGDFPIVRIDDALAGAKPRCVALKIDVEGNELLVVRGALETLRDAQHFVVAFEAAPAQIARSGMDPSEVLRLLRSIRRCTAVVAELPGCAIRDDLPLMPQLGVPRIVNIVCASE